MKRTYIVLRDSNRPRGGKYAYSKDHLKAPAETKNYWGEQVLLNAVKPDRLEVPPPKPTIHTVEADSEHAVELALDEDADAVAPEMPVLLIESTDDTGETQDEDEVSGPAWGIKAIAADRCIFSGESATVAVLDSGVRVDHSAFSTPELKIRGQNFTGIGAISDIGDKSGHGTHCASIILGREVRGCRIGVAPGVRNLLVGRIFAPGVTTTTAMVVAAIQWAVNNGAHVISMSLALNFTQLTKELIQNGLPIEAATAHALVEFGNNMRVFDSLTGMFRAQEEYPHMRGVVIIGAAGNHSLRESRSDGPPIFVVPVAAPSNALGIISVGALMRNRSNLGVASSSNSRPTLVAPGVGILGADSRAPDQDLLILKNGTSMACPHVAGLAALWWDAISRNGSVLKAGTVASKLKASCRIDLLHGGLSADDRGLGIPQAP